MARRGKRICPNCKKPLKLEEAKDSMAKASTPEPVGHGGKNWFTEMGDMLPPYIQHIANDLIEKRGKTESNAVQMAIGIVKRWAKGAGNVTATTRAAAAKAVAQWEKLKAKRKALSTAKKAGKKLSEAELLEAAVLDRILALEEGAVELAEAFFEELVEAKITEPVKEPEATPKDAKGGDSAPKDTETVSPAGERVAQLQRRLSSLGFETKVDGTFGPHTSETVKTFQRHAGLNVDGIVGAKTTEALKRAPHPAEMEDADKDSFLGGEAETPSDQAPEDLPKGQDGDVAPEAPSGETISAPRTERGKTTPAPKSSAKPPSGKLGEGESVHLYKGMGVGEKKADERVRETQAKLGHLGYEVHTDGRFGPQTEKTVKRFQRKFGLKPDGIVGPKTHRAMSGVVKKKKRLTECVDQRKQATGSTAVRLLAQERMLRTQLTEGYDAVGLDLEEFWSPQARLAAVEKRREISRMSPPHEIGTRVHVAAPTGPLGSDHGGYEGTVINHVRDPWGAHMYDVKIDKVRPGNKPRDRIAARVTHPVGQVMRAEQGDVTKLQEAWSPAARAAALMSRRSHHGFGDLHPDWMERRHDEFPGEGAAKEGDRAHGMTEIGQRAFGTVRGEHLVTDSGTRIRTVGAPQKVTNAAGYEQRPRGAAPKADHGFSVPADVKVKATKGGFDFKAPEHDEPYKVREHPKGFTVRTPQEGRMIGEFPGVESNNPTVFPTHSAAAEAVGQHIAHARRARAYWNDYAAKNPAFRTSGRASTKPSQEGI